jgi:hypothetical protein
MRSPASEITLTETAAPMADPALPADGPSLRQPRPSASVALASYNGSAFIGAQLDSILAQSELPDEIVVTDDQSSDDTLGILAGYAARSPVPIRAHRNPERLGFARNFARATSLCRSELIFFCDQDDIWAPTKVARVKDAFADPAVFLAYHDALVVTGDDQPLHRLYDADRQRALLAAQPIDPWHSAYGLTEAFRASLRDYDDLWERALNHIDKENELLAHDQWYFFLAQIFGRVAYIDEPLVRYRQHGANAVGAAQYARPSGIGQRLRQQLSHDPRIDRLQSDAALRRAGILAEIGRRTGGAAAQRARQIADCYGLLAERMQRRHGAYTAASLWTRAARLARMLARADYGSRPWRFRRRSILRDLARGVLGHDMGSERRMPPGAARIA